MNGLSLEEEGLINQSNKPPSTMICTKASFFDQGTDELIVFQPTSHPSIQGLLVQDSILGMIHTAVKHYYDFEFVL